MKYYVIDTETNQTILSTYDKWRALRMRDANPDQYYVVDSQLRYL